MTLADEIRKLDELRQSGALNDEEYAKAKARLLDAPPVQASVPPVQNPPPAFNSPFAPPGNIEAQTRQWAMFLHLSLLAGAVVPFAGLIAPIVIWQIKKTELPGIDAHGKIVINWMISVFIYGIISFALCFVLIGIPLLMALGVVCVVFPILGGIKANNGELWKYPMSITFLT